MRARSIALAALIAAVACGKDEDRGGDKTGSAASAKKAADPVEPAAAPAESTAPEPAAAGGSNAPTGEEQATAEKAAVVLEELGTIAEAARGNCDKAAAAMKAVIGKNRGVLSAAEKLGQDEGKERWLAEKFGPRTDAAKSKLMPLMERCADHEGIATVFDSIE